MKPARQLFEYQRVSLETVETEAGEIITETPITLTVNGVEWLTLLCTPVDLEALAVGFLFNEGVIEAAAEIASVHLCASGELLDVWLTHAAEKPAAWRRTTGCAGGLTAAATGQLRSACADPQPDALRISPQTVTRLAADLFHVQQLYRACGGVHTSALADAETIRLSAEDIGRHNTLDKIAGKLLLEGLTIQPRILITTGRISSEMLQKSARMGAAILLSRTSPSSLSIQLAEQYGITLVGYTRRDGFNVYTHPYRIQSSPTGCEIYPQLITDYYEAH